MTAEPRSSPWRRVLRWRWRAVLAALALLAPAAHADPVFVIDQLVITVSSEPAGAGERIATIKSGDRVELLDRQGDDSQIQLADGTSGWVKSSYLSSEPPLQRRLQDRIAEIDKLHKDVTRLESELTAARAAASTPKATPNTTPVAATPEPQPVTREPPPAPQPMSSQQAAENRDATHFMSSQDSPAWPLWEWIVGSSALTAVIGFFCGWRALDRRIRRKYGGLRIY